MNGVDAVRLDGHYTDDRETTGVMLDNADRGQ